MHGNIDVDAEVAHLVDSNALIPSTVASLDIPQNQSAIGEDFGLIWIDGYAVFQPGDIRSWDTSDWAGQEDLGAVVRGL